MARVVVITGGGTGIGAACARLMRAAGERVFITGRREAPLQAVANETGATALVGATMMFELLCLLAESAARSA